MKNLRLMMYAAGIAGLLSLPSCSTRTYTLPPTATDFVDKDTANKMLQSYLNSVNYTTKDTALFSVSVDADQLRLYLADTSVKRVKIMLAHSLEYINSGHGNRYAGVNRLALTFVLAGYDAQGDYVLHNNSVLDRLRPCPANCPPGTAASPLIP